jgi:hypothetical protein
MRNDAQVHGEGGFVRGRTPFPPKFNHKSTRRTGLGSLVAFRVGRARRIGVTAVPGRVPHSSDVQTTDAWAFGAKKTLKSKGSEAEDVVARKPTSSA